MFFALNSQRELVAATVADRKQQYQCPGCHALVRVKHGQLMRAHFAHVQGSGCATFSEGETALHLRGKQLLAAWFERNGYQVQLEAVLTALNQRPDVLVQYPGQAPLALEFQCSPIKLTRLRERTRGYWQHGYRVLWILGQPYVKQLRLHGKASKFYQFARQWGVYLLFLDVPRQQLHLAYQLLVTDTSKLQARWRTFDLRRTSVQAFSRWRPRAISISTSQRQFQGYQRQVSLLRIRQVSCRRRLQQQCYRAGGSLMQLPSWVLPTTARPPLLSGPYVEWYVQVFLALRTSPKRLSAAQLTACLKQTLSPLMAPNVCLRQRDDCLETLVAAVAAALVTAGVLVAKQAGWQLVPEKISWQPG
ncbi:competence protein CoiA [Lactiplantibacillus modestisalitolerans]|uniref:Competence protein CoiA n=2 Tax=Lactiplantibacillus modestisalitolerans TaxID=1457219 RepID=A0ABV5WUT6_9LACO